VRITHVVDTYYPQLGYQIYYLPLEMKKLGHDVTIITSDRHSKVVYEKDAMKPLLGERIVQPGNWIDKDGLRVLRLPSTLEIGPTVLLKGLLKEIELAKPDILYVHGTTTLSALSIALFKRRLGNPTVVYQTYQIKAASMSVYRHLYPMVKAFESPLVTRSADMFVAIAEEAKDFAIKKLGIPAEKIMVAQHGADPTRFFPDSQSGRTTRKSLGIEDDDFVAIYTGKIMPYKGVHILIEAAANLIRKHPEIKILVVGGGDRDYVKFLRSYAEKEGIGGSVFIHEAVIHSELRNYYNAANVAVWPSSVTISTLEAMSCGLPVIVSDVPAAQERTVFGNGFVVHNESSEELEHYIDQLYLDRKQAEQMGRAGRNAIETRLNWRMITERVLRHIEEASERAKRASSSRGS